MSPQARKNVLALVQKILEPKEKVVLLLKVGGQGLRGAIVNLHYAHLGRVVLILMTNKYQTQKSYHHLQIQSGIL